LARSGEGVELGARPAISECRRARGASACGFSMPVFAKNQGRAAIAAAGITFDDAKVPTNGDERGGHERVACRGGGFSAASNAYA